MSRAYSCATACATYCSGGDEPHQLSLRPHRQFVTIYTAAEGKFTVEVTATETIGEFTQKYTPEGFRGFPQVNNRLYEDPEEVFPEVMSGSVVRFVQTLTLTLVSKTGARTAISVRAAQPVSDLRRQVRVERTEVFYCAGNRLEEEVSFDFQGVPNNAEIKTVEQVQVTVSAGGRNLTITCSPTDSLEKVKLESIVASNSNLQATYRLKQGSTVLLDNQQVGSLPSSPPLVLEAVQPPPVPANLVSRDVSPVQAVSSILQQIMPTVKAIPTTTSAASLKAGGFHDKNILDPVHFYSLFLQYGSSENANRSTAADMFTLEVDVVSWGKLSVDIMAGATVLQLKQKIQQNIKIAPKDQQFFFYDKAMNNDASTLLSFGVEDGNHISLMCSGENSYFLIPAERFDSRGDYDYTKYTVPPNFGNRGGESYTPPAGWRRYGLKVSGLFENDIWLGMNSRPGEWIVSYHGTSHMYVRSIIDQGFDLSQVKRSKYGKGIYSAPLVTVAEGYSKTFEWEGRKFRVAFMNRVNPDPQKLKRVNDTCGIYFVSFSDRDIRPYGLLIKESN